MKPIVQDWQLIMSVEMNEDHPNENKVNITRSRQSRKTLQWYALITDCGHGKARCGLARSRPSYIHDRFEEHIWFSLVGPEFEAKNRDVGSH